MRRHASALIGSIAVAIALPWFALSRQPVLREAQRPITDRPLRPAAAMPIEAVLARDPFHADDAANPQLDATPPDGDSDAPPQIVGIAGRLPDRAIVLVRQAEGGTRALAVGDAIGRWRLVSIGADAVLFVDGARRARVELPPADPAQ